MLDEAKRFEVVDAQCYSAVISSLRKGHRPWQKSLELFHEAKAAKLADAIVHETTVQSLAAGGNVAKALEMIHEMKRLDIPRARSTCNAIVRAASDPAV